MMLAVAMLALAIAPASREACVSLDADDIRLADLAHIDSRFEMGDPSMEVGRAPSVGAKRVFWPAELLHIADKAGISSSDPFQPICFERRTRQLSADDFRTAIQSWAPGASVEVIEQSHFPTPLGTLSITPASRTASDGSVLLRGSVLWGSGQRFPVWARVRLTLTQMVVVAAADIHPGQAVQKDQVRVEERKGSVELLSFAGRLDLVIGRASRKPLLAGSPVPAAQLEEAHQVISGALVAVDVWNGAAHLAFDGRAETSGRVGETVTIRNPSSGKSFPARVTGENSVSVTLRSSHRVDVNSK